MYCRHCEHPLEHTFLDLGFAPPSNAYLAAADLKQPEKYYPLRTKVCDRCWLVQTEDYAEADELFKSDYAYLSSTSAHWLKHAQKYTQLIIKELNLGPESMVLEVACNDGYLLRNFIEAGIPCLGVEPTLGTAKEAEKLGIPVLLEFFGEQLGKELAHDGRRADLIVGNNVYAHVPDINDFTRGLKAALKPGGTITLEFPHVMRLIEHNQFDTVYHEHFSYLSLYTVRQIFEHTGLRVWNVEELSSHGGSLRIYGCHNEDTRPTSNEVDRLLALEKQQGLQNLETYRSFQAKADKAKDDLVLFLIEQKRARKKVAAYGAAAKGNTLLNYAGIKPDLLPFVCDAALSKQGKYLPGSHIPVLPPEELTKQRPDMVLILPWNIKQEVIEQLSRTSNLTSCFVTAVPSLSMIQR